MIVRRQFYDAFSASGETAAPYVDIPTQPDGSFVIVTQVEVLIRTSNGRRRIGAKDVFIDRYDVGVDGDARTAQNRLSNYRIPICGPNQREVTYSRVNAPYTAVEDLVSVNRLGFRACLDNKDRASDEQWIRIAVERYVANELESQIR